MTNNERLVLLVVRAMKMKYGNRFFSVAEVKEHCEYSILEYGSVEMAIDGIRKNNNE